MANSQDIEQNFKVGVLKELHKRQLINKEELDKATAKLQHKTSATLH